MMRYVLVSFAFVWALVSCREDKTKDYKNREDFFTHPKFGGEYAKTLPLTSIDSTVMRIAADVPEPWQGWACENAYYHLPDGSDSVALAYLDKIERAFPRDSVRAFSQLIRGEIFGRQFVYDTAFACLNDCYDISIKGNRPTRASDAQFTMGLLSAARSDYPEGIRLVTIAYNLVLSLGDYDEGRMFETLFTLAGLYRNIEDYETADYWYKKLWAYTLAHPKMEGGQIRAVAYLSENYLRRGKLDSAKILIDSAFRMMDTHKIRSLEGMYRTTRAEINVALGNCKQAMPDFKAALNDNVLTQLRMRSKHNRGLGLAYACLGQLDSATACFERALNTTDTLRQVNILLQLAKVYEKQGRYTDALDTERQGRELRQRTLTSQKDRTLERVRVKNETEQREKIAEYERQKTRLWVIIGGLLLICSLIAVLFIAYRQRQQRLIAEKEKELGDANAQVQAQVLAETERELAEKATALSISERLLTLKNTLIEELKLKIINDTDAANGHQTGVAKHQTDNNAQTDSETQPDTDSAADTQQFYRMKILTNADWLRFRERFDDAFPRFNKQLRETHKDLTNAEIRLFILLKIGFNSTEISNALGISPDSVYKSRYRLRKKLDLKEDVDLEVFIQQF